MGALRKAGVWLGLVEDDDDHDYDDAPAETYTRHRSTPRARDRYEDDYEEDDDVDVMPVSRTRSSSRLGLDAGRDTGREIARDPGWDAPRDVDVEPSVARATTRLAVEARLEQARVERATVRPITGTRPATPVAPPARENPALPAQTSRPLPATEDDRRVHITTLHPTTYNEARQIGERFRDGSPVIMNLTEMDEADAKRLVDFAAGLAFGLRGTIERVTNRVFLLSPANVQVTAEDKAKIAEGGYLSHS
jgi:cell division inhibitor SepF